MGVTNIGKWSAQASIDASGFTAGTEKLISDSGRASKEITQHFQSLASNVRSSISSGGIFNLGTFAGGAAGAFAGPLLSEAGAGIGRFVQRGDDLIQGQRRLRMELGLTRQEAAGLFQFGRESGIGPEEMASSFGAAARHIGEMRESLAQGGTGGASGDVLRRMGINAREFSDMALPQAVALVGDRMHELGNATDRAAGLTQLFGRSWRELLPLLERGSAGLAAATGRAHQVSEIEDAISRASQARTREITGGYNSFMDFFTAGGSSLFGYMITGQEAVERAIDENRDRQIAQRAAEAQANGRRFREQEAQRRIEEMNTAARYPELIRDLASDTVGQHRSQLERLGGNLTDLQRLRQVGGLTSEEFAQSVGGTLRGLPSLGQAPLLGSLSRDSGETAQMLQAAMAPQTDRTEEMLAVLRQMGEDQREQRQQDERMADRFDQILDLINDFMDR